MTNPTPPPTPAGTLEGIEVVELSEVDLDFSIEEMFGQGPRRTLEASNTELASREELSEIEFFRCLGKEDLAILTACSQSIQAVPGLVLVTPGQLNSKVFFVVEGQLRVYAPTGDKRPIALVDVGQSIGLHSALMMQPAEHAVIATEISNIIAIDISAINEHTKRLHGFALSYTALLASYVRGDNCLYIGARSLSNTTRQSYVDEITLLHNQYWLNMMLPRLVGRFRMVHKPLAVVAFAVDKLDLLIKANNIGPGMRVLQAVGHWLLDQTRPTDILAVNNNRYLLAFLPDCDLDAARQLAERLKTAIQALPISFGPNAKKPITVTLSFGITALEKGMNELDFVKKAEALVQKSLKLGGNCVSEEL